MSVTEVEGKYFSVRYHCSFVIYFNVPRVLGQNDFDDSLKICEILAEKIKIPVICVGGWRSLEEMEKITLNIQTF